MIIDSSDSLESALLIRVTASKVDGFTWPAGADGPLQCDWDRLIGIALLDNAITVLDQRVSRLPDRLLPVPHRERIARLNLMWSFKLKILEQRLHQSIAALTAAGIDIILLKGAGLGLTAYRSFSERPMADIDLLVDPANAREAHDLMRRSGWVLDTARHPGDAWDAHHHLPPLRDLQGSNLRLEIHSAPLPPGNSFQLDYHDVRATAQRVGANPNILVPEPHLHAVYIAIHFAWAHQFESGAMNAFRDFAALAALESFDWDRFGAAARRARADRACYWALRLARSLSGLVVPDAVLGQLAPAAGEWRLSLLEEHFSQIVLRSQRACPSATLRHRMWAAALETDSVMKDQATQWNIDAPVNRTGHSRALTRLGSHVARSSRWSSYLGALIAAATSAPTARADPRPTANRVSTDTPIEHDRPSPKPEPGTEEVNGQL